MTDEELDREHEEQQRMVQLGQERLDAQGAVEDAQRTLRVLILNYKRICDELRERDPHCSLGNDVVVYDGIDDFGADGSANGPFVENNSERAYRRGFHHGAYEVLRASMEGVRLTTIQAWLNDQVVDWRNEVDGWSYIVTFKWPPHCAPSIRRGAARAAQLAQQTP